MMIRNVAKALRKEGIYQAYVMKGGYSKWQKEGLPTADGPEYEIDAALYIKDEVEAVSVKVGKFQCCQIWMGLSWEAGHLEGKGIWDIENSLSSLSCGESPLTHSTL